MDTNAHHCIKHRRLQRRRGDQDYHIWNDINPLPLSTAFPEPYLLDPHNTWPVDYNKIVYYSYLFSLTNLIFELIGIFYMVKNMVYICFLHLLLYMYHHAQGNDIRCEPVFLTQYIHLKFQLIHDDSLVPFSQTILENLLNVLLKLPPFHFLYINSPFLKEIFKNLSL